MFYDQGKVCAICYRDKVSFNPHWRKGNFGAVCTLGVLCCALVASVEVLSWEVQVGRLGAPGAFIGDALAVILQQFPQARIAMDGCPAIGDRLLPPYSPRAARAAWRGK